MAAIALFPAARYTNDARIAIWRKHVESLCPESPLTMGCCFDLWDCAGMYHGPHTQVVIVGSGTRAEQLESAAHKHLSLNQSVLHLQEGEAVPQMLSAGLAENHPICRRSERPHGGVICSGFSCKRRLRTSGTGEGPGFF